MINPAHTQVCTKCGVEYPLSLEYFYFKKTRNKFHRECKSCYKNRTKEYRIKNNENIKIKKSIYSKNNREKINEYKRKNRKITDSQKEYNKEFQRKRRSTPKGKIDCRISASLRSSLKNNKNNLHWENLVGYTLEELMNHLESKFNDGMSWENIDKWHIDHIKPKCSFAYASYNDSEFKECWALENLQPLWAEDNLRKGGKQNY